MMKRQGVSLCAGLLAMLLIGCTGGGRAVPTGPPASAPASASGAPGSTAMAPGGGSLDGGGAPGGAGSAGSAGVVPAPTLVPLKVAYTAIATAQAAFWLAVEGGYFQQQGLDVDLIRLDGSNRAMPALLSGEIPISVLTGAAVAGAAAQGADVVFVASGASNLVFQVVAAPQITSFEQLRGQPVGTTGLGSSSDFALRTALRRYGIDPDREVVNRSIAGG